MNWSGRKGLAKRLVLMVCGEALQSGFHFALNLALIHLLPAEAYGVFAIVMVIGGLGLTYIRSFTAMPASIWIAQSRNRAAANVHEVTFGSGAVVLSLVMAVGVWLLLRTWLDFGLVGRRRIRRPVGGAQPHAGRILRPWPGEACQPQ